MSKHEAEAEGYDDALMLDWRGYVAEGTGANIFLVMADGKLHTPPPDCFLNGITRQTVMSLADKRQIPVIEQHITPEDLMKGEEVFVTGTAAEVTPVGSIDLLGRDRKGAFVVVHVPAADEIGDSVSGMLRRMGWVRKHLANEGEDVRGIVVVDQLPEDLAYAAAGLGGAILFKGYCLSLTFHDLRD